MAYVGATSPPTSSPPACVFCTALTGAEEFASQVLARGPHAFLILNKYPYAPGHLMAATNRHIGRLQDARPDELADAMRLVGLATSALGEEYRAEGFNVGFNQGRVAGAGIADHLHVHVVPRWNGDHNFASVLGDTRVIPESLEATFARLQPYFAGR
jgi:ATP adenylyltransferase